MKVELRVGTLVLDGVELRRWERDGLREAIQQALQDLIDGETGNSHLHSTPNAAGPRQRVEAVAGPIARAIHRSMSPVPRPAPAAGGAHFLPTRRGGSR